MCGHIVVMWETKHLGDENMAKQAKLLTDLERKRLTAVIDGKRHAVRNHTLVALSFYAGLRSCEMSNLLVGDVYDGTGAVRDTIYLDASQTKGDEGNTVMVNKRLRQQLQRYAAQYPNHVAHRTRKLIYSAKRNGFTPQTIVNLFQNLYKAAGIAGASSHSGRRQYISFIADKGINARIIQALARHKNLSTTQKYIEISEPKMRAAVELVNY